jgi:hypothetical protein
VLLVALSQVRQHLGRQELQAGNVVEARPLQDDLLHPGFNLGMLACEQGDAQAARARLQESLSLSEAIGDAPRIALVLIEDMSRLLTTSRPTLALRMMGAATALRSSQGRPHSAADQARWDRHVAALRAALAGDVAAVAWQEGTAMALEQAVAAALSANPADQAAATAPSIP